MKRTGGSGMKKICKTFLGIVMALAMMLAMMPMTAAPVYADNPIPPTGNCGTKTDSGFSDNATYTYDSGTLTISGSGEIGSRAFADYGDTEKASVRTITIGNGITSISANAFEGLTGVSSVTLPNGLKSIGFKAFYNCFALHKVTFPDTLESIDSQAFYNDGISEIDIPASMKSLNWDAFGAEAGYGDIKKVIMRSTDVAFVQPVIQTIKIPNSIYSAGPIGGDYDYQFAWTEKIPDHAFSYLKNHDVYSLSSVVLPDTITEIGASAFSGEDKLTSIDFPAGLKTIKEYAFYGTGLTDISLPASVENVGREAFNECTHLDKVTILNPECEIYDVYEDGKAFSSNTKIAGYNESTAQIFAERYNREFESLGNEPCPKGGEHDLHLVNHKATFTDNGFQSMECSKCGKAMGMAIGAMPVTTAKLSKTSYVYTGKAIKPGVTLASSDGPLSNEYYDLTYSNNVKAGTGSVKIVLKGDYYEGTKTLKFTISKASNPLKVAAKTATVKYSALKKKAQTLAVGKVITFTRKGQGTMTYVKLSGNKKIAINKKNGNVTVAKGLKKGSYKVKVKASAAGNANYKASGAKTVTFTVRVK